MSELGHQTPFLASRGIDPAIWAGRGCRRYEQGDAWVKEQFRPFFTNPVAGHSDSRTRLATVTQIVNQSPGWIMPKHAPPGFRSIPPQLRRTSPCSSTGNPRGTTTPSGSTSGRCSRRRPVRAPEAATAPAGDVGGGR